MHWFALHLDCCCRLGVSLAVMVQERLLRLQQLPDRQGILISAGKKHMGILALTLHVSVLTSSTLAAKMVLH